MRSATITNRLARLFTSTSLAIVATLAVLLLGARVASADPPKYPPTYTPPWQLRPAAVVTAARLDTSWARYGDSGNTAVAFVSGSYKLGARWAPLVRLGTVADSPPGSDGGAVLVNPLFGVTFMALAAPGHRLTLTGALTLPLGMGGGDAPDMSASTTEKAGLWARSGMDNAMFAVNDVAGIVGVDGALLRGRLTLQAEATLFQLVRVRGADAQPDETKTNLTAGLAAGFAFVPWLSASGELRVQRWLSTPAAVDKDPTLRETVSLAVGVRTKLALGGGYVAKPGVALVRGLDDPLADRGYTMLLVDLPIYFP